jgi:hypothetical protein
MSAYVVENHVIDYALSAFVELCRDRGVLHVYLDPKDGQARHIPIAYGESKALDEIGSVILAQNVASVAYRYSEPIVPGENVYKFRQHRGVYANDRRKVIAQALKAISCIEYQSCEDPGWYGSDARQILNFMARSLANKLPEISGAEWGAIEHLPDGVGSISIMDMIGKGRAA